MVRLYSMAEPLLNGLNDEQAKAITHGQGPSLILAGAGSGKTRVLTYKVAYLITEKGVDPGQILMVTFTNKAALEMKTRIADLLTGITGSSPRSLPFAGTFH